VSAVAQRLARGGFLPLLPAQQLVADQVARLEANELDALDRMGCAHRGEGYVGPMRRHAYDVALRRDQRRS